MMMLQLLLLLLIVLVMHGCGAPGVVQYASNYCSRVSVELRCNPLKSTPLFQNYLYSDHDATEVDVLSGLLESPRPSLEVAPTI